MERPAHAGRPGPRHHQGQLLRVGGQRQQAAAGPAGHGPDDPGRGVRQGIRTRGAGGEKVSDADENVPLLN